MSTSTNTAQITFVYDESDNTLQVACSGMQDTESLAFAREVMRGITEVKQRLVDAGEIEADDAEEEKETGNANSDVN